ncbi:hypothetical protein GQ457_07G008060 [Hibiscus cannabinus]
MLFLFQQCRSLARGGKEARGIDVNKQWGGYRYQGRVSVPKPPTGTWVSILAFGYRYQLLENSFWAPLKSDFLHMGPYDYHICSLSSDDVFILKYHL